MLCALLTAHFKMISGHKFVGVRRLTGALIVRNKSQVQLLQTSIPTIYTTTDMDAELDLSRYGASAKALFGYYPSYIHPAELNYQLPSNKAPEFAFVGRSNVGKSSLVDLLLGSRKLVKVSKEPGCTRSINYYGLAKEKDSKNYMAYLVDLPGYGFAKKSKEDQQKWTEIIHSYVSNRDQSILRRVFVMVDSRRGIQNVDLAMMDTLNRSFIPYQLLFTKVDLISAADLRVSLTNAFEVINSPYGSACLPFIHTLSSTNNVGIDALKLSLGEVYSHNWQS